VLSKVTLAARGYDLVIRKIAKIAFLPKGKILHPYAFVHKERIMATFTKVKSIHVLVQEPWAPDLYLHRSLNEHAVTESA